MKTIAIACNTLKDEIMMVVKDLKVEFPVLWIESGLHQTPEKLNRGIQEQINRISNVDYILLLFGSCGNSLYGLKSEAARIVFPRVDDCICLFLGGNDRKREWDSRGHSYYLTKGYLQNEANIWTDYTRCISKYGEEKTQRLMKTMLKNYQKLRVIDTGAFDPDEIMAETKDMAVKLGLEHEVVGGSLHILTKAVKEEWDDDFIILQPGESINYSHLGFC